MGYSVVLFVVYKVLNSVEIKISICFNIDIAKYVGIVKFMIVTKDNRSKFTQ